MSEQISHGTINHTTSLRKTDYLYRVSMKGIVKNDKGEVLVVKETGRDWWDLQRCCTSCRLCLLLLAAYRAALAAAFDSAYLEAFRASAA